MKRFAALAVLILALLVSPGHCASLLGEEFPDTVKAGGAELTLNGLGLRTKFATPVYVAGLYLPQKTRSDEVAISCPGPKCVELAVVTDVKAQYAMTSIRNGLEYNGVDASLVGRVARFFACFDEDLNAHDRIRACYVPGVGTTITYRGKVKATIEGEDFFAALLKIWLSDNPKYEELKKGVLGG